MGIFSSKADCVRQRSPEFEKCSSQKAKPTYAKASVGAGGKRGIRTLGTVARTTVFETVPFDRSGIFPLLLNWLINSLLISSFDESPAYPLIRPCFPPAGQNPLIQ